MRLAFLLAQFAVVLAEMESNRQAFGKLVMIVVVDNNYSFETYVRSPSYTKNILSDPLTVL